jgi:hypothetical protein
MDLSQTKNLLRNLQFIYQLIKVKIIKTSDRKFEEIKDLPT